MRKLTKFTLTLLALVVMLGAFAVSVAAEESYCLEVNAQGISDGDYFIVDDDGAVELLQNNDLPDTNYAHFNGETCVLTLYGVDWVFEGNYAGISFASYANSMYSDDLTIELVGENSIELISNNFPAIYVMNGDLTIKSAKNAENTELKINVGTEVTNLNNQSGGIYVCEVRSQNLSTDLSEYETEYYELNIYNTTVNVTVCDADRYSSAISAEIVNIIDSTVTAVSGDIINGEDYDYAASYGIEATGWFNYYENNDYNPGEVNIENSIVNVTSGLSSGYCAGIFAGTYFDYNYSFYYGEVNINNESDVTVKAYGDAIYGLTVNINDSDIELTSTDDGIEAEIIDINESTMTITADDDGIYVDIIDINESTMTITCDEDGIDGDDIDINESTITITADDDGIEVDNVDITDSDITITCAEDGIDGDYAYFTDSTVTITADDDGIEADYAYFTDSTVTITSDDNGIYAEEVYYDGVENNFYYLGEVIITRSNVTIKSVGDDAIDAVITNISGSTVNLTATCCGIYGDTLNITDSNVKAISETNGIYVENVVNILPNDDGTFTSHIIAYGEDESIYAEVVFPTPIPETLDVLVGEDAESALSVEPEEYLEEYYFCNFEYAEITSGAHTHEWSEDWSANEFYHWHECEEDDCPIEKLSEMDGYGAHIVGQWQIVRFPTAFNDGLAIRVCTVCGFEAARLVIPAQTVGSELKFTVTVETSDGGTATGECTVDAGGNATVTIVPEEGFEVSSVTVNGEDFGSVTELKLENIMENKEVVVTFKEIPWVNPFTDIFEDDEYYDAIEFVNENGLFFGTSETEFSPEMTMTRSMFATVIGRLAGVDPAMYDSADFTDVVPDSYYEGFVAWAAENGIVNGYDNGKFGVDDEITVEQAIVMLSRFAGYLGFDVTSDITLGYSDADEVSAWALPAVQWAVENGIYLGTGGELDPTAPASRALVAEMIYAFANAFMAE